MCIRDRLEGKGPAPAKVAASADLAAQLKLQDTACLLYTSHCTLGLVCQGLLEGSDAVRIGGSQLVTRQQNPLQYRLSHQLCERQPVLQRCARRERFAGVFLPDSLRECCLDAPSRMGLESGIQLLRLRRGRSFRLTVLQHVNVRDSNRHSL